MPPIRKYKCNACTIAFYAVWGGFAYVEGYDGKRVILTHPLENPIIERTLNKTNTLTTSNSFPAIMFPINPPKPPPNAAYKVIPEVLILEGIILFKYCNEAIKYSGKLIP